MVEETNIYTKSTESDLEDMQGWAQRWLALRSKTEMKTGIKNWF